MTEGERPIDPLLDALQERAKELDCLYRVGRILGDKAASTADVLRDLVATIPPGWKYPDCCPARIALGGNVYRPPDLVDTPWSQAADILVDGEKAGEIAVFYLEARPPADEGPFLKEERRLLDAIADRIGTFFMQQRLQRAHRSLEAPVHGPTSPDAKPWGVLLRFLRRTDQRLLARITAKMINHLCARGVEQCHALRRAMGGLPEPPDSVAGDENRPQRRWALSDVAQLAETAFEIAARNFGEGQVIANLQAWINEERASFLISTLESPGTTLADVIEAIERYQGDDVEDVALPRPCAPASRSPWSADSSVSSSSSSTRPRASSRSAISSS